MTDYPKFRRVVRDYSIISKCGSENLKYTFSPCFGFHVHKHSQLKGHIYVVLEASGSEN